MIGRKFMVVFVIAGILSGCGDDEVKYAVYEGVETRKLMVTHTALESKRRSNNSLAQLKKPGLFS
jgi:hypothetical protein